MKQTKIPKQAHENNSGLSIKLNMLWNSAGSLTYLGCQWLITVLVVRLSDGYDAAGTLSLAMSVYNMFSSLAIYRMRTYQVSDVNHENTVGEYFALRLITCGAALVLILAYALITCPIDSFVTIGLYAVYKIASLLIDVLHGLDQQNRRMDYIGKSLSMQGAASLIIFCVGMALANNLDASIIGMTAAIVLIGIVYDLPRSVRFEALNIGISKKKALHLLGYCLPIVIAAIACGAAPSIPRQYLAAFSGSAALGIYASVAAPAAIIQMGASYIYNPLLGYFSEAYSNKDLKQLATLLLKAGGGIAALGIISALALHWLGGPLLVLFFGESIAPYTYLLTPIIAVAMVTAYAWFLNDVLVTIRDFRGSFIGNMAAAVSSIPLTLYLVPPFDMNGVSFASLAAYGLGALIMLACLITTLLRKTRNTPRFSGQNQTRRDITK